MRTEQEIFDELGALCANPGYTHAIAFFCFRDNVVDYDTELKANDYAKLFSKDRLVRTEISTLIGLMLRAQRDLKLPTQQQVDAYINRTEALLKELHEAMNQPMLEELRVAFGSPPKASSENPFANAAAMREPIFYGAESAYSFQYKDLAVQKYTRDEDWLRQNKGFSPKEAKQVLSAISSYSNEKLLTTLKGFKDLPQERWTVLSGFEFSPPEIAERSGLPRETVSKVIDAFSFPEDGNPSVTSLHEFNSANAFPIFKGEDDNYILFQYVGLTEALYDTPFYWMGADKGYERTAMTNRGLFTEEFTAQRLERVFGAEKVFRNVELAPVSTGQSA